MYPQEIQRVLNYSGTQGTSYDKYNHRLSDPDFYINEPDLFNAVAKKLELAKKDLEYFETRWIELEEMKN